MAKANETHSFQGMVKDTKESLLEPKYYIDAHNIRVTTREDNPQQYICLLYTSPSPRDS